MAEAIQEMNDETSSSKNHVGNLKTSFMVMTIETKEEAQSYGQQEWFWVRVRIELHLRLDGFPMR